MRRWIYDILYRHVPRLWFVAKYRVENEYQNYVYSRDDLVPFGATLRKYRVLAPVFEGMVRGRRFLELGCDTGFFTLQAAMLGSPEAVGVDRNAKALHKAERARRVLGIHQARFMQGVIPSIGINEPFDVVLFMSAIHYMFSDQCGNQRLFNRMDLFMQYLSGYAKEQALIEFVLPEDSMAQKLVAADLLRSEAYSEEAFLNAVRGCFRSVQCLGNTGPTRRLYLASERIAVASGEVKSVAR